jgi:probable HAF family extracellular repeat protein
MTRQRWSIILALTALAALGLGAASPAAAQTYTLQNLGTLGGTVTNAYGINSLGQVVGASATAAGIFHAFLYNAGKTSDLGTLGGDISIASAINNRGQVVGTSALSGNSGHHAFLWDSGRMTDLGALPDDISDGLDINDRGQIVGSSETETGATHAVLWQKSQITDLDTRSTLNSSAVAVNNLDQVVGTLQNDAGDHHAFLWKDGKMADLGTLGGTDSFAFGLNDRGQVVGYSSTPGDVAEHAFLWENGQMKDLGTLGGLNSYAYGINNRGQVTGAAATVLLVLHAFCWDSADSEMHDLNSQIPPGSGWELRLAAARLMGRPVRISDAGEIAGAGELRLQQLAYLLSPPAGRSLSPDVANAAGQAIEQLRGEVKRANEGRQDAAFLPLICTLSAAETRLTSGNTTLAMNLLQAFIRQVNALIDGDSGRLLTQSDGQRWNDAAQAILNRLRL